MEKRRPAALGGDGWSPRTCSHQEEVGTVWSPCGIQDEVSPLTDVLLHRPGRELASVVDPDRSQMLSTPEQGRAARQHDDLASAYLEAGVNVHLVQPAKTPPPNLMFVADLMLMTPEGAILGRPASTVRAGEERIVASRLAAMGIPIVRTLRGIAVFEGADASWLDPETVLLAQGLRTNQDGANQVESALNDMGVTVLRTRLPEGSMHLMGQLRFLSRDLVVVWRRRTARSTLDALSRRGYRILDVPDEEEAVSGMALNFVTLAPMRVLLPAGNPRMQQLLESRGVHCASVHIDELARGAGGIGCLTGVIAREGCARPTRQPNSDP